MGNQTCNCFTKPEESELSKQDNPSSLQVVKRSNFLEGSSQSHLLNIDNKNSLTKEKDPLTHLYETFHSKHPQNIEITKLTDNEFQNKLSAFPHITSLLNSPDHFSSSNCPIQHTDLIDLPPIQITNSSSNQTEYYKGQANRNGDKSGEGELLTSEGNYYKGGFDNNVFNGKGIYINDKGNVYSGDWKDGKSTGEGEYKLISGHRYKGTFRNNMKNGKGEETYPDGTKYIGEFVDNVKHGKGELYFPEGDKYEGMFENDVINGEGVFTARDGRVSKGMFCNGKLNGNAVTTFPDNSQFEGKYVNDVKNGIGTYRWSDGKELNVKWVKNVPEGKGKINVGNKEMDVLYRFGKMIQCKDSTS